MNQILKRIGPYPIERELGRGGMGVVYLARDTKLDRAVAIKVLPEGFAADPERLARFEREAKILASLNHPNIAGIHAIEHGDGHVFLALQYIDGDTLAQRLAPGPMPIDESIDVCRQIASAIEAAHENGVIHRDLKPSNVKISSGGEVKVLDFGLAKGGPTASDSGVDLSRSPTMTYAATGVGVILGTAAYMSPEQARGKPVDKRTDIWSFGCVLYECLVGEQLFSGETVSDTIARILEREPDWSRLPAATPASVRHLLQRCLEKDAKKRLRDIGDARLELEEALATRSSAAKLVVGAAAAPAPARARVTAWPALAGAIIGAVLGVLVWSAIRPGGHGGSGTANGAAHLSVTLPPATRFGFMSLTPDGSTLILSGQPRNASGENAVPMIYVRRLDSYDIKALPGTDGVLGFTISADSRWIYFSAPITRGATRNRLEKVPADGSSPPVTITDWQDNWGDMSVLNNGDLLIMVDQGGSFVRIPANGGAPKPPVKIDAGNVRGTWFIRRRLPGDKGMLVEAITYGSRGWMHSVGVLDLKTAKARILIEDGGNPTFLPTGHLLFSRGTTLLAAPFDLNRLQVTGAPVAIFSGLLTPYGFLPGWFRLADNGTLAYFPGAEVATQRQLAFVDPGGNVTPWGSERRPFLLRPAVSPDGRKVAAVITNSQAIDEIWVSDLDKPMLRRIVAIPDADCDWPIWSPDGREIAYQRTGRDENDGIYVQDAEGRQKPRQIVKQEAPQVNYIPTCWAPDGSGVLVTRFADVNGDIQLAPSAASNGGPTKPKPLIASSANEYDGAFSRDGHWIAYTSNESGRNEVYACMFSPDGSVGNPVRVSSGGGATVRWSADGKRLFYQDDRSHVMAVSMTSPGSFSPPERMPNLDFEKLRIDVYPDVLPDGRFLGILRQEEERDDVTGCNVVLNWLDEFKRRTSAAK